MFSYMHTFAFVYLFYINFIDFNKFIKFKIIKINILSVCIGV